MAAWQSFAIVYSSCLWSIIFGQDFNSPFTIDEKPQAEITAALLRSFTSRTISDAFRTAAENIAQAKQNGTRKMLTTDPRSDASSYSHNYFQQTKSRSKALKRSQEIFEETTRVLRKKYKLTPQEITLGLADIDLQGMIPDDSMQECLNLFRISNCSNDDPYRTFDGTCNNLENPFWGMASSCFERLLDPVYADGISEMRNAASGRDLPTPRTISLNIHSHVDNPNPYVTHMFMQWGQFLTHDISLSPLEQQEDNQPLQCCPLDKDNSPQCAPILLKRKDPHFSSLGINCLNNARTVMCSTCSLGPRQQINQVTAFIDGSVIYGTSRNESDAVRQRNGTGTLMSVIRDDIELLPPSSIPDSDRCSFQTNFSKRQFSNETCFRGGDSRVNQHQALTSFHTIFLRHHNRIARELHELNQNWDDERLFQETRRIVGAQFQLITYAEYLPIVFGPEGMKWYELNVQHGATFTEYDSTVQPSLLNEFSTAAHRFGHSTINSFFPEISKPIHSSNRLQNLFIWPFDLYRKGHLEKVVRGLFQTSAQNFDRHMVRDVTDHLYQFRGNQSGLDLASLNVLRGRDHGIPPYVQLVRFCGGPNITRFRQLDRIFQRGYRQRFESIYESVEDIDLFTGGLAERPSPKTVIGPTFTCILSFQFYNLKYGDRFYFEHGGQAGSFTLDQLREIKKTSLAKIICENTNIDVLQRHVMTYSSKRNPEVKCRELPDVNLQFWSEK